MTPIEATIQNGRVEVPAPAHLPDGTKVVVEITPFVGEKIGIAESDWRDDAGAIAEWDAWLKTIEPIDWPEFDSFDEQFQRFNVEAVRKQMLPEANP